MERKIGEIFQYGEVTLKVVKEESCGKCYFNNLLSCANEKPDYCTAEYREDQNEIYFELINP